MRVLQPSPRAEVKPGSRTNRQRQALHAVLSCLPARMTAALANCRPCTGTMPSRQDRMNPPPLPWWNGLWHPTENSPWTVWAASEQKRAVLIMKQLISIATFSLLSDRSTMNACLEKSLGKKKEVMHNWKFTVEVTVKAGFYFLSMNSALAVLHSLPTVSAIKINPAATGQQAAVATLTKC